MRMTFQDSSVPPLVARIVFAPGCQQGIDGSIKMQSRPTDVKRIAVVGFGARGQKAVYHIRHSNVFHLAAVCDPNQEVLTKTRNLGPKVAIFSSLHSLLERNREPVKVFECAYVAIPHHAYASVVSELLRAGTHVLKEKPAALSLRELQILQQLSANHSARLVTASQSRFGSRFSQLSQWLPCIGTIHFIEGSRKINVRNLGEGWRSLSEKAGGGALIDIGWHLLDLVLGLLGADCDVSVESANLFSTRSFQQYDCEDSAHIKLSFNSTKNSTPISCDLRVSRLGPDKCDEITIVGSDGILSSNGDDVYLSIRTKAREEVFKARTATREEFQSMLVAFHTQISARCLGNDGRDLNVRDAMMTKLIAEIYEIARHTTTSATEKLPSVAKEAQFGPTIYLDHTWKWPKICTALEEAVIEQLHKTISIYDNSGILGEFEETFKQAHDRPEWNALLHNSGTNALAALYYAAQLSAGDEVIFPVYTFHATCTPAMQFGIVPIFCDCGPDGNIAASEIGQKFTRSTRAVVITHMWGMPCDMQSILKVLSLRPDILLLEDCSHAHGATIQGQMVGTFGDGAAWSLQGQKVISGGEGGVTLTKHADFHYRQLIWGHYNKRCRNEIPKEHMLYQFSLTGSGAKNRAHPLAIAIALHQLKKLPDFRKWKAHYAKKIVTALGHISFLHFPHAATLDSEVVEHGWYAMVMLFKENLAPPGLTREQFARDLVQRGLEEFDIPKSTGLLHREPLYLRPQIVLPHVYGPRTHMPRQDGFVNAQSFYNEACKIPVWATEEDAATVDLYVRTIASAAERWSSKAKL